MELRIRKIDALLRFQSRAPSRNARHCQFHLARLHRDDSGANLAIVDRNLGANLQAIENLRKRNGREDFAILVVLMGLFYECELVAATQTNFLGTVDCLYSTFGAGDVHQDAAVACEFAGGGPHEPDHIGPDFRVVMCAIDPHAIGAGRQQTANQLPIGRGLSGKRNHDEAFGVPRVMPQDTILFLPEGSLAVADPQERRIFRFGELRESRQCDEQRVKGRPDARLAAAKRRQSVSGQTWLQLAQIVATQRQIVGEILGAWAKFLPVDGILPQGHCGRARRHDLVSQSQHRMIKVGEGRRSGSRAAVFGGRRLSYRARIGGCRSWRSPIYSRSAHLVRRAAERPAA